MTTSGRRILGYWVAAVAVGGLLAFVVRLALLPILDNQLWRSATNLDLLNWAHAAVQLVIEVASAIAIAGPPAYMLGRRLVGIELPWVVASVVAGLVVTVIPVYSFLAKGWTGYLMQAPSRPSLVVVPLLLGVVAGCATGVAQAIVLKPYVRGVAWWIAASIVARGMANVVVSLIGWQVSGGGIRMTTLTDVYVEEIVGAVVGSLIVGIVTGLVLVGLLGELDPERTRLVP
jgi:hypothetical protein